MICINCGSSSVVRDGDNFTCDACHYQWDVAHEQANAGFLKTQGRKPAEPMPKTWALGGEITLGSTITLTTEGGESTPEGKTTRLGGGIVRDAHLAGDFHDVPELFIPSNTGRIIDEGNPQVLITAETDRATLEAMKIDDLKALAAMQGIDLTGASKKSEIVDRFFLEQADTSNDESLANG